MHEEIMQAVKDLLNAYSESTTEKLGEGDTITGVFNDCVLTVGVEEGDLKIEFIVDPFVFDRNVFSEDEGEEE